MLRSAIHYLLYLFVICDCAEESLLDKDKNKVCENLVEFIRVINANIRDFHLEIKRAVDEFTGDYYYVLV